MENKTLAKALINTQTHIGIARQPCIRRFSDRISLTQSAEMNIGWVRLPLRQWPKVDLYSQIVDENKIQEEIDHLKAILKKNNNKTTTTTTIPKFMDSCIKALLFKMFLLSCCSCEVLCFKFEKKTWTTMWFKNCF